MTDVILEQKISATPEYLKKERIREELQSVIASRVNAGSINDEKDLQSLIADMNMALAALKMIPLSAWRRLAQK